MDEGRKDGGDVASLSFDRDGIQEGQVREERVKIKPNRTFAEVFLSYALGSLYFLVAFALGLGLLALFFLIGAQDARKKVILEASATSTFEPDIDWSRLPKWTDAANPVFLGEVEANADRFNSSPFDQFALGLHERDNGTLSKSYYYLTLAAARAHPGARTMRDQIKLPLQDERAAMERFKQALTFGGGDANFLLGMLYLGDKAFEVARAPDVTRCNDYFPIRLDPTWPPCERNFRLPGASRLPWPNDLLADSYNINDAYLAFARGAQCFHPEAPLWLNAMENSGWVDQVTAQALRAQASNQVQNAGKREEFCNGGVWFPGREQEGATRPQANDPVGYCTPEPGDGALRAQRNRPGRSGYDAAEDAKEPSRPPICAKGAPRDPACDQPAVALDSAPALEAADKARVCLRLGDAMLAAGDVDLAFGYYRAAIARGRKYGAQASIAAGDRLRALSLTCEYTTASLGRIARGEKGNDFINIADRQRALKALGLYSGRVDGSLGEQTRDAIRRFQRELGFDETSALSPLETVVLICQAAEGKGDSDAQNLLGVMYAAGLGVVQSTDLALQWLDSAARRGNADAYYNLAIIYSTGTILSSYRLCDARFNDDLAKAYYADAARLGHPRAQGETFVAFKARIVDERNTYLEIVTPSCSADQLDANAGQNK